MANVVIQIDLIKSLYPNMQIRKKEHIQHMEYIFV
jgi:hypothetical protein